MDDATIRRRCHDDPAGALAEAFTAHRDRLARMIAADPLRGSLVRAALRERSIADFLAVPPWPGERGFADELHRVRRTPAATALADLRAGGPVDAALNRPDLAEQAADLLEWVWTHTVEPDWAHRRRLFEADIVARRVREVLSKAARGTGA